MEKLYVIKDANRDKYLSAFEGLGCSWGIEFDKSVKEAVTFKSRGRVVRVISFLMSMNACEALQIIEIYKRQE